jgi:hypothetical protein
MAETHNFIKINESDISYEYDYIKGQIETNGLNKEIKYYKKEKKVKDDINKDMGLSPTGQMPDFLI